MDGRQVILFTAIVACGGVRATSPTLPDGARVLARGSLAYAAVAAGDAIVTIELEERFALIVRDPDSGRPRRTVDLGAAERDLVALAVHGDTAWVGGDDRAVRTVDLTSGAVTASNGSAKLLGTSIRTRVVITWAPKRKPSTGREAGRSDSISSRVPKKSA